MGSYATAQEDADKGDGLMKLLLILFTLFLLIGSASAVPPVITLYNNSVSGTNMFPHQQINTNIRFNASADQVIVTWVWYTDNVNQSNNASSLNESWATPGYKNVTVWGSNSNGESNHITWNPIIERLKSNSTQVQTTISESSYTNLTASLDGDSFDVVAFLQANAEPFTGLIGNLFYLFVFVLPLVIIWIRQEKALIPAGLGIIVGIIALPFLPESFLLPSVMFLVITVIGVLYSIYKERG